MPTQTVLISLNKCRLFLQTNQKKKSAENFKQLLHATSNKLLIDATYKTTMLSLNYTNYRNLKALNKIHLKSKHS